VISKGTLSSSRTSRWKILLF